MSGHGSWGLFGVFFLPHWCFSEQETATSKTVHTCVSRKSLSRAGAATGGGHWHSCQGPALSPAYLHPALPVPCPSMCQDSDTSTVTDPWCKPCGCAMSPRASGATTALGGCPHSTTETATPTWCPLMSPRHSLGKTRRFQPLWLAMTLPLDATCRGTDVSPHAWDPPRGHLQSTGTPPTPPPSNHTLPCASTW